MKKIKKIFTAIMSMVLVIAMVGTGCVFANSPDSIDTVGDGTKTECQPDCLPI